MAKAEVTSIKDLDHFEGLEAVRKKPEMYIGSTKDPKAGLFHLTKEGFDNSIDEVFLAGRGKRIRLVVKNKGGKQTIYIGDDGGGIPVEIHAKTKLPGFEMVFCKLHAGGKFANKEATRGTHGVGVSCTNALSSYFDAWTFRNKKWHHIAFEKGVRTKKMNTKTALPAEFKSWTKGTVIKFIPDSTIFKNQELKHKWLLEWIGDLIFLCPGISIEVQWDKEKTKFKATRGLEDYLKVMLDSHDAQKMGKVFTFKNDEAEIAFTWSTTTSVDIRSFVNTLRLREGGTHEDAFFSALGASLRKYKPAKITFSMEDIKIGMLALIHVKIKQPKFDSQTKEKLASEVTFKDELKKALDDFFKKNATFARKIIKQASEITKAKENLKKQMSIVKKSSKGGRTSLPGKLFAADSKVPAKQRELFLLEGDSAGGTAKAARLPHQEVLKLRGKFNNAYKTPLGKFLENEIVQNILMCLGTGIDKDCDVSKLRVGMVFILADADKDGYHIASLIISLFTKYLRPIVDAGLLYIVDAPLFVGTYKDSKFYGDTIEDIEKQLTKGINIKNVEVVRMKGWAECKGEDLRRFAFDNDTRKLIQVKALDAETLAKMEAVMGKEVDTRKEMLGVG